MSRNLGKNHPCVQLSRQPCSNCNRNLNQYQIQSSSQIIISSIVINGTTRNYAVFNLNNVSINNKVLLCFPAGGTDIEEFCQFTQINNIANCLIIFLGQKAYNSFTFQNAFPWLYSVNNNNDVLFVDSVLQLLFNNNIPNLFICGKSDGAGFAMLYPNLSQFMPYIKGIGVCAGAYFGLDNSKNIDVYSNKNIYKKSSTGIIVPYNIVLPKVNIPVFIFHGTSDNVMPYNGQNYMNSKAYNKPSLWKKIDVTVNPGSIPIKTNTYTADLPTFVSKIVANNNLTQYYSSSNSKYSWSSYNDQTGNVLNFITINGQGHCWSGHYTYKDPKSFLPSNFYLDSTYLFIKFFNLLQGKYQITVNTIPPNLLTYNNIPINPNP